ncbi:hypothetical protein NBRC116493_06430 [Aurantivibrio infirmus]
MNSSRQQANNNSSLLKTRRNILSWHRWIGIVSALFVIVLATSGLLLNHTSNLDLDKKFLSSSASKFFYGIQLPEILAYEFSDLVAVQDDSGRLFLNRKSLGECQGKLVGIVVLIEQVFLACERELIEVTEEGEIIERLGPAFGLPIPIDAFGDCEERLCWISEEKSYGLDVETLAWVEMARASVAELQPVVLSAEDQAFYQVGQGSQIITWERWILDLHSGRIGGGLGVILVDLMALLFMISAVSGVIIWALGRRKARRS